MKSIVSTRKAKAIIMRAQAVTTRPGSLYC